MTESTLTSEPITDLLHRANAGDRASADRVLQLVYALLHRMASKIARRDDAPIGATSLVHEMYLKLFRDGTMAVADRGHFYALASSAMRQIMVDKARALRRHKRGGDAMMVTLDNDRQLVEQQCDQALALDEAIQRLDDFAPRLKQVVECRFFGGLTEEETAIALGVSSRTVRSDWVKARALLRGWLQT